LKNYTYETKIVGFPNKITVNVIGVESLTQTQVEELARREIRRLVAKPLLAGSKGDQDYKAFFNLAHTERKCSVDIVKLLEKKKSTVSAEKSMDVIAQKVKDGTMTLEEAMADLRKRAGMDIESEHTEEAETVEEIAQQELEDSE
tara:strand:- start:1022 stop:1456 length:435 start_codon:yes stop_codon:yes gene_type:complete